MTNSQTKISTFYYNKSGNFCLIVCHEALFNWKLFKLGSVSVKDIRKNVPILQVGGSSHILSTPPVVWVVLLHKMAFCQSFISTTVNVLNSYILYRFLYPERLCERDTQKSHFFSVCSFVCSFVCSSVRKFWEIVYNELLA